MVSLYLYFILDEIIICYDYHPWICKLTKSIEEDFNCFVGIDADTVGIRRTFPF